MGSKDKPSLLSESSISYQLTDDKNILMLIQTIRNGINFSTFKAIANKSPFSLSEWSKFLQISERTMQRHNKEKKSFDPISSEKILEVALIYQYGTDVFGNKEKFNSWLETKNLTLGGIQPKELLDNSFGIGMLKDVLTRIEYGVLA